SKLAQDDTPVLGDSNRMFKMRGEPTICGNNCPVVRQDAYLSGPCIDHGLKSQDHASSQAWPASGRTEIGYLRFFVQGRPNTMAHKNFHHRVTALISKNLDSMRNIRQVIANFRLRNAHIERLTCRVYKMLCLLSDRADCKRNRMVTIVTIDNGTAVNANDISLCELPLLGRN